MVILPQSTEYQINSVCFPGKNHNPDQVKIRVKFRKITKLIAGTLLRKLTGYKQVWKDLGTARGQAGFTQGMK